MSSSLPKRKKLSAQERLKIVLQVVEKEKPVSRVCKKAGISQSFFYKLKKQYLQAGDSRKEKLQALEPKRKWVRRGRRLSQAQIKPILKVILKNPEYGIPRIIRQICADNRKKVVSHGGIQTFLFKLNLNTKKKRRAFARWARLLPREEVLDLVLLALKRYKRTERLSSEERLKAIRLVEDGASVAYICQAFQISPRNFYKWQKRYNQSVPGREYQAVTDRKPIIERYWRQVTDEQVRVILRIVVEHPEYSTHKIAKILSWIGNHGVQNVFRRENLNTYEKRLAYSQAQTRLVAPVARAIDRIRPALERIPPLLPIPPPSRERISFLFRPLVASLFSSVIFINILVLWLRILSQAPTLGAKLGLFFASISLLIGGFFFAYSMKYYLTLAIVLSFSRQPLEEGGGFAVGLQNHLRGEPQAQHHLGGEKGGWLARIFGLNGENGGVNGNNRNGRMIATGGLQPSLEHIKLKRYPFVSIHLPFYNEKRVAERILKACASMDYPDYEVIVVDDSTDETTEIVKRFAQRWNAQNDPGTRPDNSKNVPGSSQSGPRIKVLHRPTRQGFKGGALAYTLEHMDPRTEFVVVFDADFIPYPDTLELFIKYFQVNGLDLTKNKFTSEVKSADTSEVEAGSRLAVVGGYQWHVLNKSENWITRGVRAEYAGSYVIERPGREILGLVKQISGSVYMIRADLLRKIGWGVSITEDFQLTLKLYEQGYKVIYSPYIQAPAECVSTLKRLIRQRMRWAEGHSNNIRKMFFRLMSSPKLSLVEKLEVIYLSPYYLQAAFFMVGTFAWILAETVFRARLPFWTALWGWSLVLTNFLSLPLVNAVGLFLEESEEKDYFGLLSFIALSYILVPFQAYASVKGFLEKEEGPWFRTPKTGKITDIFTRGRFYRWVSGILPGRRPIPALATLENSYLALATANNQFNNFKITKRRRKRLSLMALVILLLFSTSLIYFSPLIESSNPPPAQAFGTLVGPNTSGVSQESTSNTPEVNLEGEGEEEATLQITELNPAISPDEFYLGTVENNQAEVVIPAAKEIQKEKYVPYLLYQYPDRYEVEIASEKGVQKYVLEKNSLKIRLYEGRDEPGLASDWVLKSWLTPSFQYRGYRGDRWKDYIEMIPFRLSFVEEKDFLTLTASFSVLAPEEGVLVPAKMNLRLGFNGEKYVSEIGFELGKNPFSNRLYLEQFGGKEEWFYRKGIKGGFKAETNFSLPFAQEHFELVNSQNQEARLRLGVAELPEGAESKYKEEEKRLKEEIILKEKPKENVFTFPLNLQGLKPANFSGEYHFFDQKGTERFFLPKPFMVDANGARSEEIKVGITLSPTPGVSRRRNTTPGVFSLTLTPNPDWLSAPERAYPVTIDPTIAIAEQPIQEIIEKRTASSKTYIKPNADFIWEGQIGVWHYKENEEDPNEEWKEIETTFVPSSQPGYAYEVTRNDFKVYFKRDLRDEFYLKYQLGEAIIYQGIEKEQENLGKVNLFSRAQIRNNTLTYPSIFEGIDLKYTVTPSQLLEEYIVWEPGEAEKIGSLAQRVRVEGAEWKEQGDGSVDFYRRPRTEDRRPIFSFPKPVLYELENPEERNYGIRYEKSLFLGGTPGGGGLFVEGNVNQKEGNQTQNKTDLSTNSSISQPILEILNSHSAEASSDLRATSKNTIPKNNLVVKNQKPPTGAANRVANEPAAKSVNRPDKTLKWAGFSAIKNTLTKLFQLIKSFLLRFMPRSIYAVEGSIPGSSTQDDPGASWVLRKVVEGEGKEWLADEARSYPVVVDTTVDKQVGASGDDGRRYTGSDGFDSSGVWHIVGYYDSSSYYACHGFARWTGVSIEGTIGVSYIEYYAYADDSGTPELKVYGVDEDNPAAPTSATEFDDDPLTTAAVDWDGNWTSSAWNQSPSLNNIFQELVDSYDISNDAVMVQVKDDLGTGIEDVHSYRPYDHGDNTYGPKLHIEYNQVDTSTSATATGYSFQRKTWFDGTRLWSAFHSGTEIEFWYSEDWGASWTENTSATITVSTNDFTIEADTADAFIAYTDGYDIKANEDTGTYPAIDFAWGASPTTVYDGSGSTDEYDYPSMSKDSNNKVWITARHTSSASPYLYLYNNGSYEYFSDFLGGATSPSHEYTSFTNITGRTEIVDNKIKLKITEELDETAYIDRVFLRVDGDDKKIIELSSISGSSKNLLLSSDDNYLIMNKGDEYYLEFPGPASDGKLEFAVEGYYLVNPLTSLRADSSHGVGGQPQEIISQRTRTSKTYQKPGGGYILDATIGPMHYKDAQGDFQDIQTDLVPSSQSIRGFGDPAYEMVENEYEMFVLGELNSGVPLVRYTAKNTPYFVQFAPHNLQWRNDLNQLSLIATPATTPTEVSNNVAKWIDVYGAGIDLRFIAGYGRMQKWLDIASPLPPPPQFIIDGGNPVLEFAEVLSFHKDLGAWINDKKWNKKDEIGTAREIVFKSPDGEIQFVFPVATGFGEGESVQGEVRLKKSGNKLYVTARFPYSWLQTATYPVHLDTTVDKQVGASGDDGERRGSTVFDTTDWQARIGKVGKNVTHMFARWTGVSIAGTIDVSYIELYATSVVAGTLMKVYGVDEDNPAAPTTYGEFDADPLTTPSVDWDTDWSDDAWNQSPSLNSIFQELVGTYTISNDAVMVQVKDDGSPQSYYNGAATYDYSGNTYGPKLHIEYTEATYKFKARQSTNANDISAWGTATTLDTSSNTNKYGVIVPLDSGDMYAAWIDGTGIEGCIYDEQTDNRWEDSAGSDCTNGANQDAIDTGVSGLTKNMSAVVDTTNYDVHLAYISDEATDQVSYRRWDNGTATWDSVTLVADAASDNDAYVTVSYDTTNSDVYALWIDTSTSDIFYSKCDISTDCDTAAEWAAETNWQSGGTNTNVTSNYSGAGMIFALWTEGTGSPYSITWDWIIIPENLWLFLLLSPFAGKVLRKLRRRRKS